MDSNTGIVSLSPENIKYEVSENNGGSPYIVRIENVEDRSENIEDRSENIEDRSENIEDRSENIEDGSENIEENMSGYDDQNEAMKASVENTFCEEKIAKLSPMVEDKLPEISTEKTSPEKDFSASYLSEIEEVSSTSFSEVTGNDYCEVVKNYIREKSESLFTINTENQKENHVQNSNQGQNETNVTQSTSIDSNENKFHLVSEFEITPVSSPEITNNSVEQSRPSSQHPRMNAKLLSHQAISNSENVSTGIDMTWETAQEIPFYPLYQNIDYSKAFTGETNTGPLNDIMDANYVRTSTPDLSDHPPLMTSTDDPNIPTHKGIMTWENYFSFVNQGNSSFDSNLSDQTFHQGANCTTTVEINIVKQEMASEQTDMHPPQLNESTLHSINSLNCSNTYNDFASQEISCFNLADSTENIKNSNVIENSESQVALQGSGLSDIDDIIFVYQIANGMNCLPSTSTQNNNANKFEFAYISEDEHNTFLCVTYLHDFKRYICHPIGSVITFSDLNKPIQEMRGGNVSSIQLEEVCPIRNQGPPCKLLFWDMHGTQTDTVNVRANGTYSYVGDNFTFSYARMPQEMAKFMLQETLLKIPINQNDGNNFDRNPNYQTSQSYPQSKHFFYIWIVKFENIEPQQTNIYFRAPVKRSAIIEISIIPNLLKNHCAYLGLSNWPINDIFNTLADRLLSTLPPNLLDSRTESVNIIPSQPPVLTRIDEEFAYHLNSSNNIASSPEYMTVKVKPDDLVSSNVGNKENFLLSGNIRNNYETVPSIQQLENYTNNLHQSNGEDCAYASNERYSTFERNYPPTNREVPCFDSSAMSANRSRNNSINSQIVYSGNGPNNDNIQHTNQSWFSRRTPINMSSGFIQTPQRLNDVFPNEGAYNIVNNEEISYRNTVSYQSENVHLKNNYTNSMSNDFRTANDHSEELRFQAHGNNRINRSVNQHDFSRASYLMMNNSNPSPRMPRPYYQNINESFTRSNTWEGSSGVHNNNHTNTFHEIRNSYLPSAHLPTGPNQNAFEMQKQTRHFNAKEIAHFSGHETNDQKSIELPSSLNSQTTGSNARATDSNLAYHEFNASSIRSSGTNDPSLSNKYDNFLQPIDYSKKKHNLELLKQLSNHPYSASSASSDQSLHFRSSASNDTYFASRNAYEGLQSNTKDVERRLRLHSRGNIVRDVSKMSPLKKTSTRIPSSTSNRKRNLFPNTSAKLRSSKFSSNHGSLERDHPTSNSTIMSENNVRCLPDTSYFSNIQNPNVLIGNDLVPPFAQASSTQENPVFSFRNLNSRNASIENPFPHHNQQDETGSSNINIDENDQPPSIGPTVSSSSPILSPWVKKLINDGYLAIRRGNYELLFAILSSNEFPISCHSELQVLWITGHYLRENGIVLRENEPLPEIKASLVFLIKVNHPFPLTISGKPQDFLSLMYNEHRFPSLQRRFEIASMTGLTEKQVNTWFKNRRQRDRRNESEESERQNSRELVTTSIILPISTRGRGRARGRGRGRGRPKKTFMQPKSEESEMASSSHLRRSPIKEESDSSNGVDQRFMDYQYNSSEDSDSSDSLTIVLDSV